MMEEKVELTDTQHDQLDRIEKRQPDAKVVGTRNGAPVVQYPSGARRVVQPDGTIVT